MEFEEGGGGGYVGLGLGEGEGEGEGEDDDDGLGKGGMVVLELLIGRVLSSWVQTLPLSGLWLGIGVVVVV